MTPQARKVLSLLREPGPGLTPLQALYSGCGFRLGARIWELRHEGYVITTTLTKVGESRVAVYRLVEP